MSACDCCIPPDDPVARLEWDTISTTASKCGEVNPDDGKLYREVTREWDVTKPIELDGSVHNTGSITYTYEEDEDDCEVKCSGYGTTLAVVYQVCPEDEDPTPREWSLSGDMQEDCSGIDFNGHESWCGDSTPVTSHPYGMGSFGEDTATYADEYTDEELLAKAEDKLPDYDDDWDDGAGTYKEFTGEGHYNLTIRKARWRIRHRPTASCYLKVWLNQVFEPADGGDPVVTPISPYVWTGSGTPCYASADLPADHEDNEVVSAPAELELPEEDGELRIVIEKYSCLPDYEPEDIDDSGWPQ